MIDADQINPMLRECVELAGTKGVESVLKQIIAIMNGRSVRERLHLARKLRVVVNEMPLEPDGKETP